MEDEKSPGRASLGSAIRRVLVICAGGLFVWIALPDGAGGQAYPLPQPTPPTPTTPVSPPPPPAARQFPLLTPFPVIRIVGRTSPRGARISLLTVRAAAGSYVVSRCIGGRERCPYEQRTTRIPGPTGRTRTMHVRAFERSFRSGVVLRVYVVDVGRTGKFTSFKIRSKRSPRRNDGCVADIVLKPATCPGG
jgi:hypothetical protein